MITFKSISKAAAACGLTLLASSFAQAQNLTAVTGSIDIYNTDFQKTFTTGNEVHRESPALSATGSTDIWSTDFQKTFATGRSVNETADVTRYQGSIDIWSTDFKKALM